MALEEVVGSSPVGPPHSCRESASMGSPSAPIKTLLQALQPLRLYLEAVGKRSRHLLVYQGSQEVTHGNNTYGIAVGNDQEMTEASLYHFLRGLLKRCVRRHGNYV